MLTSLSAFGGPSPRHGRAGTPTDQQAHPHPRLPGGGGPAGGPALGLIALITLANLRGIKESGTIFAFPTYVYIVTISGLAANTAYADFPRLSSIIARDGYLPRQFGNRGDRLVFSNGIVFFKIDVPLEIVSSPYRELVKPLETFLDDLDQRWKNDTVTVVIPEFVVDRWYANLLHNQSALAVKLALLDRPGTVVTSVPYQVKGRRTGSFGGPGRPSRRPFHL
ncbi:MAG TPA: hypothetical protein VM142_12355 [Acidimicrobiales bacterium]|nr:hypothetical protein [Acidimicrobiales bacterium]